MNFAEETGHPVVKQLVSHGIPTIDTLDENYGIWIPTNRIKKILNITHRSASEDVVGKGTTLGDVFSDYRKENYKTDF